MRVQHHIALGSKDPFWGDVERLSVAVDKGNDLLWVIDITEDDPTWQLVAEALARHGRESTMYTNLYTDDELGAAERLRVVASGHHGFPQPEDEYFELTFDPSSCRRCGIHTAQQRPFHLRSEPGAKHSQFIQLNWVYDEFFVREEARATIEAAGISGVTFMPVLIHRTGEVSQEVTQMHVDSVLPPAIDTSALQRVTCMPDNEERFVPMSPEYRALPYCGRVKFHLRTRGPLHCQRSAFVDAPTVVKSHEWFGSGGSATKLVICSQEFRALVLQNRWRGLRFEPLVLVD